MNTKNTFSGSKTGRDFIVKVLSSLGRLVYKDRGSKGVFLAATRVLNRSVENTSPSKAFNLLYSGMQMALKREKLHSWPAVLKIDISPLCSLRCTYCVHATPDDNQALAEQSFNSGQRMKVDQFRRIVDEVKGKTSTISLFYLGDPLMHRDLDEICAIASEGKLNTHISTHFSYALSEERIKRLVTSGLTHLTVCVDGMTQQKYERTRVGGKLDLVLNNLRKVCQIRRELGQIYPKIEVQFLKFPHNIDELESGRRLAKELGVDQFTDYTGSLDNMTEIDSGAFDSHTPKKNRLLPQCFMPFVVMVIKFNGDVIPCCYHRLGKQYVGSEESKVIGNVFRTGVWDVWNSDEYGLIRRIVSNPEKSKDSPEMEKTFCAGCPQIFDVNVLPKLREGFTPPAPISADQVP